MNKIYEVAEWVRIKDHDDYFEIISIKNDSVTLSDITGHAFTTDRSNIERKCTDKELRKDHPEKEWMMSQETNAELMNEDCMITYYNKEETDG